MKTLLSLCLFAGAALATPVGVTLIAAGQLPDSSIGPYVLQIGSQDLLAMCFDDQDFVTIDESWSANLLSVGQAAAFTGDPLVTLDAEIWLYNAITASAITPLDETALQEAAWSLMNPGAPDTPLARSYEIAAVQASLDGLPGLSVADYSIVEPLAGNPQHVQSFVVELAPPGPPIGPHSIGEVPEAGTLAGAGCGLLGLGLIRRKGYGRLVQPGGSSTRS